MNGYVITDTSKKVFVCKSSNNYTLSTDSSKACLFETKTKANSIYNSLSKIIKGKGVTVKPVTLQVEDEGTESKTVAATDSSKYIISVLSDTVAKLNARHLVLNEELSKYDRQRTDIEHYIEFNTGKLNACDGYKAYKLLQDVLLQRRKVKDELQIIQVALDRIVSPDELAQIDSKVKALEARQYTPREFKDLF
jgi:hypothetical protein